MKCLSVIALSCVIASLAEAQVVQSIAAEGQGFRGDTPMTAIDREAQVQAATDCAIQRLYKEIEPTSLNDKMTVGDFLLRTRGKDEMMATLQRAEQIGGPRWIDERTCQVQLEISGSRVAGVLIQLAASKPQRAGIGADVLAARLADWDSRTFSTTGSSTGSKHVESITPPAAQERWTRVADEARRQAIGDAKIDAVMNVFDSIAPIPLAGGKTIGDALEIEAVSDPMHQWFADRPVTSIAFTSDLKVEIALAAPPEEIAKVFREAFAKQTEIPAIQDEAEWSRIGAAIVATAAEPMGTGQVPDEAVNASQPMDPIDRDHPPSWVDARLSASGTARKEASKLRSARAAEANAIDKLDAEIRELRLTDALTVGQAASQNPAIEEAVKLALINARIMQTDYERPDGTVGVTVELELRRLWDQLLETP